MSWELLGETGIDYAGEADGHEPLSFPVLLERSAEGEYLIVDEIGLRKNLTTLSECRTLRVDLNGEVLFDSVAHGMTDAFGCLLDGGRTALLRRTSWELQLLSPEQELERRIDLSLFTQHLPRLVSHTPRDTFLVAALDNVYEVDLVEVDHDGRLLWFLPRKEAIGCPTAIQLLDDDHVLVADEFGHVVSEIRRDGSIAWQYGRRRHPAGGDDTLSSPMGVRQLADGRRWIADSRNHRILSVSGEGPGQALDLGPELCCPTFATEGPDGHRLICDAGNERVLEIDAEGETVWQYGQCVARRRSLSFPRSVEVGPDGSYLVADTAHDRVVSLSRDRVDEWPADRSSPLFWPRCARRTPAGTLVVADGRNSRVVELTPEGTIRRQLCELDGPEHRPLDDPHDVCLLPDDRLLITDPGQHVVVETDWRGRISWIAGRGIGDVELRDPHSAQRLDDGRVLISDTGNGRLVWLDADGELVASLDALSSGERRLRLDRPRFAWRSADGTLLIVDSGNNRVLAATDDGELIWELSEVPGSRLARLSQPRWAQLLSRHEVLVSDHSNHRILHLRHRPADREAG